MRKIVVGAQVSMDGVMQAPGAPAQDPTKGFNIDGCTARLRLPLTRAPFRTRHRARRSSLVKSIEGGLAKRGATAPPWPRIRTPVA